MSAVAVATWLMALVGPLLAYSVFSGVAPSDQKPFVLPSAGDSWRQAKAATWWWRPPARWAGQQSAYYARDGRTTGLYVQYNDGFFGEAEVIGSSRWFALEDSFEQVVWQKKSPVLLPDGRVLVDEARVRGRGSELLAWSWYLVGDASTSNDYEAKLLEVKGRLGLGALGVYRVVITMPLQASVTDTRVQMQRFLDEHAPRLYENLQFWADG
ncbi:MAG: EpsI family protein [Halioglobus sp.]|nr:EpsI family protein [Halioglobus sp.]